MFLILNAFGAGAIAVGLFYLVRGHTSVDTWVGLSAGMLVAQLIVRDVKAWCLAAKKKKKNN